MMRLRSTKKIPRLTKRLNDARGPDLKRSTGDEEGKVGQMRTMGA